MKKNKLFLFHVSNTLINVYTPTELNFSEYFIYFHRTGNRNRVRSPEAYFKTDSPDSDEVTMYTG